MQHPSDPVLKRRSVSGGLAGLLATPFLAGTARAQQRSIQVGIWAGDQGEFVKRRVIPAFERDTGCKVYVEEGLTLTHVAKMRAERDAPRFTVMFVDDFAVDLCRTAGLIEPLPADRMHNLRLVPAPFLFEDGYGVAIAVSLCAMFYNTVQVSKLESYADLWSPAFARQIALSSIGITGGMFMVIAAAAVATGKSLAEAQFMPDEGFRKLADLKPNVLQQYTSSTQAVTLVAQGEASIGAVSYSKFIYPYFARGAPVAAVLPKEGTFPGVNCQVLVKGGPNQDLGAAFMNRMLDPQIQKELAEYTLAAPTVAGISLSPEVKKYVAYPETEMQARGLVLPDWAHLNRVRGEWTDRWNKVFVS
jgi:putative spermidine/putrescine transport system substrate-binding protein